MNFDRVAEIPVRHKFKHYICRFGYSEAADSFTMIEARALNSGKTVGEALKVELESRVDIEPGLKADLLEAIAPEYAEQIAVLREKAVERRADEFGSTMSLVVFFIVGYALIELTSILGGFIGYDNASLVTYLPCFFAVFIIHPIQYRASMLYKRRYCGQHGHKLEKHNLNSGKTISMCKRCYMSF